ncbi:unnamed protein product, partial [Darwinula stevensoni]
MNRESEDRSFVHKQRGRPVNKGRRYDTESFHDSREVKEGRESDLTEEDLQYLKQIFHSQDELVFDDDSEREVFVENVLNQFVGRESCLAFHQMPSRCVERLLTLSTPEQLHRIYTALGEDLRKCTFHSFASHVLQTSLVSATIHVAANQDEKSLAWVVRVSKYLLNNIHDMIGNQYSSHIVRTAIQCLAGIPSEGEERKGRKRKNLGVGAEVPEFEPPPGFLSILEGYVQWFLNHPQLIELLQAEMSSRVIQTLLLVTHWRNKKLWKALAKFICGSLAGSLAEALEDASTLHVVEVLVVTSNRSIYKKLYEGLFENQISLLATHHLGNFTLQKLLSACPNQELLVRLYDLVSPHLPDVFHCGYTGVLLSLSEACRRHGTKQSQFLK